MISQQITITTHGKTAIIRCDGQSQTARDFTDIIRVLNRLITTEGGEMVVHRDYDLETRRLDKIVGDGYMVSDYRQAKGR